MANPIPILKEKAISVGCKLNEHDRLCFPRALVEDVIAAAPRNMVLYGREVVLAGPGRFLSHRQTLELMKSECLYPKVVDRASIEDWEQEGSLDIRQRTLKQVREILSSHYPKYIEPPIDGKIRKIFPIRLTEKDMLPENGRWSRGA